MNNFFPIGYVMDPAFNNKYMQPEYYLVKVLCLRQSCFITHIFKSRITGEEYSINCNLVNSLMLNLMNVDNLINNYKRRGKRKCN